MVKKLRLLMAVLVLLTSIIPTGMFAAQAADDQIEIIYNGFEDNDIGTWANRGSSSIAASKDTARTGDASLKVTGSTANWHGAELVLTDALPKGGTYTVSGYLKLASGSQDMKITMVSVGNDGNPQYVQLIAKPVSDSDWVQLESQIQYAADATYLSIVFESATGDATPDFYLDDFVLTGSPKDLQDISVPVVAELVYDFENGDTQGWGPRGNVQVASVTETAQSGASSLKTTGRTMNWNGPSLNAKAILYKGAEYEITGYVKLVEAPAEPVIFRLTMEQTPAGGDTAWVTVAQQTLPDAEWTAFSGTFTFTEDMSSQNLYAETIATESFYIDNIVIKMTSAPPTTNVPVFDVQEELASLKDVFADDFAIGAAIEPIQLDSPLTDKMLKKHYNSLVAENVMKMDAVHPTEDTYNWANADRLFQYAAENDMVVRYHTLVWHSQCPEWFFIDEDGKDMSTETDPVKKEANKALLLDRLEKHVRTIVERYGDRVDSWDVVNEVIDPSYSDGMRRSKWYLISGTDYIKTAFRTAKEVLDENGWTGKLYINDFSTHDPAKLRALYNLVSELLDEGVPIDGVGHQTHINIAQPTMASILNSIKLFGDMGLDNQITELDVSIYTDNSAYNSYSAIPRDSITRQGYRFKELFEGFRSLKDYISNVTFWGVADDHTWLNDQAIQRTDAPFAFDINSQAKPAYWGMVDPSQLPILNLDLGVIDSVPYINGVAGTDWELIKGIDVASSGEASAVFKASWNNDKLYIFADVSDASVSVGDKVEIYIDGGNEKAVEYDANDVKYTLARDGSAVEGVNYSVSEYTGGYSVEAAIPLSSAYSIGNRIGFDIRFTDADAGTVFSWNDKRDLQDTDTSAYGILTLNGITMASEAVKGTPVIDAELDSIWNGANQISTDVWVTGTNGSTSKVRTMWDDEYLYVYAEVEDNLLTLASANAWEQDSVEVFVDQNNAKTATYEGDDGQFRINYENTQSFGGNAFADNIKSATKVVDGGYIVEAAIRLDAITPQEGTVIGFDFQVNNDQNGDGVRDSVAIWCDPTGQSYQNTSRLGALKLVNTSDVAGTSVVAFSDINSYHWATKPIEFLASKGIINGSAGAFNPGKEMTRADFITLLVKTLGLKADVDSNFVDVAKDSYYYNAVGIAKKLGIAAGDLSGNFNPNKPIIKQDMLVFTARAIKAAGKTTAAADASVISKFLDASQLAGYAKDSVTSLINDGIVDANGSRFNPLGTITRAEAAVMLYEIYNK